MSFATNYVDRFFKMKRFDVAAFVLIGALVLIAYSNTFTASFHFDDNPSIIENATIRHITADNILQILQGVRPVVYFSIMLNYAVSGLNVVGWHAFNIGVHIANSIFVYLLVLWTLTSPALKSSYEDRSRRISLFVALIYAVHPIQTESVTYIISRTELLATCFYLATFLLFIKGSQQGRVKTSYLIGMVVVSLLAMASKEWAVTLPAMLMLYDYLFIAEGKLKSTLSRWYVFALVALPWAQVAHTLDLTSEGGAAGIGFNVKTTTGLTPETYFLTSLNVLWTYVRLLILPINQNLDYDYPIARTLFEMPTILSFLGHCAVAGVAIWLFWKKKNTLIPFGVAWFYIGISPVQSVVPIVDVIFEHRAYMPSFGAIFVFVLVYEKVFDWWYARKAVLLEAKRA